MPIPGWTLPGVMNAGAAQILLKSGLQPDGDVVLAGSGPLLFLLATQLHRAGTTVRALLDTTPPSNWLQAAPHFLSALAAPDYLWRAASCIATLRAPAFRTCGVLRHCR